MKGRLRLYIGAWVIILGVPAALLVWGLVRPGQADGARQGVHTLVSPAVRGVGWAARKVAP